MNTPSIESTRVPSLHDHLDELDYHFQNLFDQFGNAYCCFDDINHLIATCPLEFLLIEIQHLILFLRRH